MAWENQVVKIVVPYFAAVFGNHFSEVMLTLPILSCLARQLQYIYQQGLGWPCVIVRSNIYQQLSMTLWRQLSHSEESKATFVRIIGLAGSPMTSKVRTFYCTVCHLITFTSFLSEVAISLEKALMTLLSRFKHSCLDLARTRFEILPG
jgi:hypothetical protein